MKQTVQFTKTHTNCNLEEITSFYTEHSWNTNSTLLEVVNWGKSAHIKCIV